MNTIFDIQRFADITNANILKVGDSVFANGTDNNDIINTSGNEIIVNGNKGSDKIYHTSGEKVTIYGGAGNESIYAYAESAYIDGGDGNDIISLDLTKLKDILKLEAAPTANSNNATIRGGAGNDTIYANADGENRIFVYDKDSGNDVIYGFKEGDAISLSSGEISSAGFNGEDFVIEVDGGKITLKKTGDTLVAGEMVKLIKGTDTVSYAIPALYQGTKYADSKINTVDNYLIDMLAGDDVVVNSGSDVTIYGGSGADSIYSSGSSVLIEGGAGNDSITNLGSNVTINSGAGADKITLSGSAENVTVTSGAGNDYIDASNTGANVYVFNEGEGNNTVKGFKANDTIRIDAGLVKSSEFVGKNYVITLSKGSITLEELSGVEEVTVILPTGTEKITIPHEILGTKGADNLTNSNDGYKIDAGAGNDKITNDGANLSIFAGAGNDTITNNGAGVSIDAGAGNDMVQLGAEAENVALSVGAGNDVISIEAGESPVAHTFSFGTADGNNTLFGLNSADILQFGTDTLGTDFSANGKNLMLTSGKTTLTIADYFENAGMSFTTLKAGEEIPEEPNAFIPKILQGTKNGEKLTLGSDAIGYTLNALAGNDTIDNAGSNVTIYGGAGIDSILNSGDSAIIDGGDGVDEIINSGSNVSISGGAGNDVISISAAADKVTINGGVGNDDIIIVSESEKEHIFEYKNGDGNDNIYGYGDKDKLIIEGDYKTEVVNKDFVISAGKGRITINDVVGKLNKITINDETITVSKVLQGTTGNDGLDKLTIDSSDYLVDAFAGNDTIKIADEVTGITVNGGAGNDYIFGNSKGSVFEYAEGDGNDTIEGFTANDTIHLTEGTYSTLVSGDDLTLSIGKGSITLKDVIGKVTTANLLLGNDTAAKVINIDPIIMGTAKNDALDNEANSYKIMALGGNDTVENYGSEVEISLGAGNDYAFNDGDKVLIFGEAGNDTIENFGSNVTIDGGAGNDYLYSDGNGASVAGGAGNDTIELVGKEITAVYSSGDGNDTIYGFEDNDTLRINSAQISSATADGTDVILKIGTGSVRLVDMAGRKINYAYDDGTGSSTTVSGAITGTARADKITSEYAGFVINGLGGNDSITNSGAGANINGGTGADSITNTGDEVSIAGGTGNDIISSKANNVTIEGNSGHDKITIGADSDGVTVTGGTGNDTIDATGASKVLFNYANGDGKDVILGFSVGDTLKITSGSISTLTSSGSDALLKIGNGSIRFNNVEAANISVSGNTVTYTSETGNGNRASDELWFTEDDTNFIGGAQISDITAQDYSVTNVAQPDSADELAQIEKLTVAYSGDR